ncbi:MAG TPA: hypothetical protein VHQ87_17810, partial [Rhizobacter sp.]|nr:hypothetical protein [Rhizobacter sp.]
MELKINAYTAESCEIGIAALTAMLAYYKAQPPLTLGGFGIAQHQAQPAVAENTGNQETVQSHTGPLVGSAPEVEALPASTSEAVIDD